MNRHLLTERVLRELPSRARRFIWRTRLRPGGNPDRETLVRWLSDRGDETLRVDYPLTPDSLVFDVGGYRGDWSAAIVARYNPNLYVFEPIVTLASALVERFASNSKVRILPFGLLDMDTETELAALDDGSSLYVPSQKRIRARFCDVASFINDEHITSVDLIKLNIEGGEFPVLRRLLDTNTISRFINLQIQFHSFFPDAVSERKSIRATLSVTHELTYDYPFVWENWRTKP